MNADRLLPYVVSVILTSIVMLSLYSVKDARAIEAGASAEVNVN